jgi:hypothetical protein
VAQFREWIIVGLSVVAFILLLKLLSSYLPDEGMLGALKRVVASL